MDNTKSGCFCHSVFVLVFKFSFFTFVIFRFLFRWGGGGGGMGVGGGNCLLHLLHHLTAIHITVLDMYALAHLHFLVWALRLEQS